MDAPAKIYRINHLKIVNSPCTCRDSWAQATTVGAGDQSFK